MRSEGSTSADGSCACAVCGGAAAVYCRADAAALCVPCDAAVHAANPLASRHERVPLAMAVMASSGVYDGLFAAAEDEGGSAASSSWATTTTTTAQGQGQGSPNSSSSSFSNGSGHDDTSLFDLLADVNLMAGASAGAVLSPDVVALPHGAAAAAPLWLHPGLSEAAAAWTSWPASSEAVAVPSASVAAAADREARVRRYREKRKNRRFQKTIRYASRKAYAEARPRVKGRFVKRAAASGGAAADSNAADSNDDDDDDTAAAADGANKFWLYFSDVDSREDGVGFHHAASYGVVPSCF